MADGDHGDSLKDALIALSLALTLAALAVHCAGARDLRTLNIERALASAALLCAIAGAVTKHRPRVL